MSKIKKFVGGVLFTSNKKQYPIIQRNKSHERGGAVE